MLAPRLLRRGEGAFAPPALTDFELTAAPDGGWSWFMDPRAVYYNGKTYFGYVDSSGNVAVRSYTHATETVSSETILHAALDIDDHAAPSFLIRDSDQKILAFYTAHDDTTLRLRISSNAEDISAFASEVSLDASAGGTDYTYPVPIQLTAETNDPIYVFYRDIVSVGQYDLVYTKSTDGGSTWAAQTKVIDTNLHTYWKIAQNGTDRIDFAVTDEHPFYADGSLYHFFYQGGAYYKSDGSSAGSLPLDTSDMTQVYDGTGSNDKSWVWDIAIDPDGNPRIAYATFPSVSDHRYHQARWSGLAWSTSEVAAGGDNIYANNDEEYYSGGIAIDRIDTDIVYCSRQVSGQWEMYRYLTLDDGASWTERAITESSSSKQIRPVAVRDAATDLRVVWMDGTYSTYTSYSVGTTGAGLQ